MANLSGWGEGIVLSLVFVIALGVVMGSFNLMYGKDYNIGLDSKVNSSKQLFLEYGENSPSQLVGGEVTTNNDGGLSLKSSFGLMTDFAGIVWSFITGGWIEQIIGFTGTGEAGTALAWGLRMLWIVGVLSAVLYALFKWVI